MCCILFNVYFWSEKQLQLSNKCRGVQYSTIYSNEHLHRFFLPYSFILFILTIRRSFFNALTMSVMGAKIHSHCFEKIDLSMLQSKSKCQSPSVCYNPPTAAQQGNTVWGNTKRELDARKTVNVADIRLKPHISYG